MFKAHINPENYLKTRYKENEVKEILRFPNPNLCSP